MWKKYFVFTLKPGRVITRQFGEIDFRSDNIEIAKLQRLYEDDFPYLKLTDQGMRELYGIGEPVAATSGMPVKKTRKKEKKNTVA